ncbi:hypothetical protein LCI18_003097 [Fusarium solani-melongenae]|uniref:Uncharacterized protein n=1 Tax=Fusarium solani subsp. cucurbitae TaxID=2747967 RepID=A0ACD3YT53_FUSSC|nr:hypothetical protein LCI18_003097 [Fusarium solani-melongenae]
MARTYPTVFSSGGPRPRYTAYSLRKVTEDEYRNERDKKRALLLYAVMGDQERASQSRLLQMPAEILTEIIDLLGDSKSALANLALVNSDCRQLAHTSQFAEVTFDYSAWSKGLFAHLAKEAGTPATKPSISTCVRRATFAAHPSRDLSDRLWADDSPRLSEEDIQTYIRLRNALAHGISAMPNLEALIWISPCSGHGLLPTDNQFEGPTRQAKQNPSEWTTWVPGAAANASDVADSIPGPRPR